LEDYYKPVLAVKPQISKTSLENALKTFQIDKEIFKVTLGRFQARENIGQASSGRGWTYTTTSTRIPTKYQTLNIWMHFRLKLPLLDEIHDPPEIHIIRVQPNQGIHDVVFVDMDPTSTTVQIGIRGNKS
jgi:hypothetical protein